MAVDIFLQINKVTGESTDSQFAGAIDVLSWSWGMTQAGSAGSGTGSGTGKVNIQDISITKFVDKATPSLAGACCAGTPYTTATLTMRKAGNTPLVYMVIALGTVTVSGVSQATSSSDDKQTETISLHFATVQMTYTPQNADGSGGPSTNMAWNIPANSAKV